MGTLAEKLTYLSNAVDDIQDAINEKGVTVDDTVALGSYGAKIREIETGSVEVDTSDIMAMWGARSYYATTVTPTTKTYTSLQGV